MTSDPRLTAVGTPTQAPSFALKPFLNLRGSHLALPGKPHYVSYKLFHTLVGGVTGLHI